MRSTTVAAMAGTLAFAITALSGCLNASATGTTAFFVKDAPADNFTHVYVSFTKVEVHQVQAANATGTDAQGDHQSREDGRFGPEAEASEDHGEHDAQDRAEGPWLTILSRNVTVDLKAFSGNASAFLDSAQIPPGSYNAIRLTVTAVTGVLANGTTVPVKVPGGALRIRGEFTVVAGKETDLTLDFNLARSLRQTDDGAYILKPVVRLASEHREEARQDERSVREARRDDLDRQGREASRSSHRSG
jgi:hypothetical protein